MNLPLVSICSITYNHEPYIRQCLDSFLMQQTNFPIEIIINDDCSTDGTTEIIREYAEKHPDKIFPVFHEENLYSQGDRGMFKKFVFPKARGKYIALCEGDDYWTDPHKLQKQIDFLERHPEYSMVCCDADITTTTGRDFWFRYKQSQDVPFADIVQKGGAWLHTATLVFRREYLSDMTDEANNCHVTDYPLAIHMAMKGKVFFMAERMASYRYLSEGSWSATTKINETYFNGWLSEIRMLQSCNAFSQYQYDSIFQKRIAKTAIFYLRHAPEMRRLVLEIIPNFPRWLSTGDLLKWWKIKLGIKTKKQKSN